MAKNIRNIKAGSRQVFALNMARRLDELALSDAEVARRMSVRLGRDISRATVGRWRRGIQEPGFDARDVLAQILGIPVFWLYKPRDAG